MPKGHFKPFTAAEEQKIKDEYLDKPVKRLAGELNTTFNRIMRFLKRNDLHIPRELIEQRKKDSQKKKGEPSPYKGKKQSDWMSPEAIERTKQTRFKKGHVPHNTLFDGAIVANKDKTGRIYQYIRISKRVWELYHRYLWEQAHGKIPEEHVLIFIDGDTTNVSLNNLKLISYTENMLRNSKHNYPEEIIPYMVLCNKLEKRLKELDHG